MHNVLEALVKREGPCLMRTSVSVASNCNREGFKGQMGLSLKKRGATLVAGVAVASMVLAACGSGSSSSSGTTAAPTKVAGGTAYFAEGPGAPPNYIFPMTPGQFFSINNLAQFQILMYRPLYFFGVGQQAVINNSLSLANPPVYSNNNQTVTVTLKPYVWSNGEPVSARDVVFWMNLLKANTSGWAAYVPGSFPDNVTSYQATSANTVVFNLNKSYNPTWFTYNELSQITPLPIAWDKTAATDPAPSPTAANLPDTTTAGAQAVYKFLDTQSRDLSTYATNPIWQVVDGPWKLSSFTTQGKAVFVPNTKYSGPVKPSLSQFVELPFTTDTAEFNVLAAGNGAITYGYIPVNDLAQKGRITGQGYTFNPWYDFGINYFVENYHNPVLGPVYSQLYFRQAFQELVDQPQWVTSFYKGLASPTYGPVPTHPANPFADATSMTNPYPYSVSSAVALLKAHGWTVTPGGVDTCTSPGSGANQCGAGVAAGTKLSMNLQYMSGATALAQSMQALKSAASEAGIQIALSSAPFNQVISNAVPCKPTDASCSWNMENWGGGWEYSPDNYPTGGELYATGAGSNYGSYSDPQTDSLINATHTSANPQAALNAYQDYLVKQLPNVWQPYPPYELSMISNKLGGVTQNAYLDLTPETWYLKG